MRRILLIMIGLSVFMWAQGRFHRDANGIVADTQTNLQWQDDYSDNGDTIKSANWTDAIAYCEGLALDEGGWRLPNKKELLSIVDYSVYNHSISSVFKKTTSRYYWSSTTTVAYTSGAWVVHFYRGNTSYYGYGTLGLYVRCVRAGQ